MKKRSSIAGRSVDQGRTEDLIDDRGPERSEDRQHHAGRGDHDLPGAGGHAHHHQPTRDRDAPAQIAGRRVVDELVEGEEFLAFYQFIYDAATGYLGRGIAITGGLVMMGVAAGTGKVVIAAAGMVLAIFGALGPTIIDQIFGSALIY